MKQGWGGKSPFLSLAFRNLDSVMTLSVLWSRVKISF
jgi:hypothetical protein